MVFERVYDTLCTYNIKIDKLNEEEINQSGHRTRKTPIGLSHDYCIPIACIGTPSAVLPRGLLKQLSPDAEKNKKIKMEKIIKFTVNTGQVMFSGEIYYY